MEKIITPKWLNKNKEDFVQNDSIIERIWLSNKKSIREIVEMSKWWEEVETYLTLCPFYDFEKTWWIKWDYKKFEDIDQRYKNKFEASLSTLKFLNEQGIKTKVNFLLADNWIITTNKYNKSRFDEDIYWIKELYKKQINDKLAYYNFTTFSEFWIKWQTICNISEEKTINDTIKILENFWIDTEKFKFSLEIIERAFKSTWAYYLIKSYLEENKQLNELIEKSIFINTEAVWPLNNLYTIWNDKLDKNNLLVTIKI